MILYTLFKKKMKEISDCNIVIITNDNDYLQLATDDQTTIMNMQFKDITSRGCQNAKFDLYNKAIYGDKSDNIHKIAPFITKEKSLEVSCLDYEDMLSWLKENDLIEKFQFNMNLVSFENIPVEMVKSFYNSVEIVLT